MKKHNSNEIDIENCFFTNKLYNEKRTKMKKTIMTMLVACIIVTQMCMPVSAATKTYRIKRYYKSTLTYTDITWSYKKDTKVTESAAVQARSGMFVSSEGAKRVSKKTKSHKWSCKTGFYLGVDTPIGTIGYKHIWNDYATVDSSGKCTVQWDD